VRSILLTMFRKSVCVWLNTITLETSWR